MMQPLPFLATLLLLACQPQPEEAITMESDQPKAETLATRDIDATLDRDRVTVTFAVPKAVPEAAPGKTERLGLYLEGIDAEGSGVYFEVYAELPEGAAASPDSPHYVGTLSSFGPKGEKGTTVGYDVTRLVRDLQAKGRWDGELALTFVRRGLEPPPGQPEIESAPGKPVKVKRVRLVRESSG
jgi:hypothetical protein